jgi:hypothetical protein
MSLPFLAAAPPSAAPFRFRGLYVESKWGPDLMALDDWRHLIDEMAFLRMNSLGIGVYGCWVVQYDGKRTEFLMVPFPDHPRLQTPKTIRWYSPAAQGYQELSYLPRMFGEDFLGQVVAYGREQGVAVRPHFNGPGHSTLIPTVYPEVSAKEEDGRPTGFGYCLTSERTYELLFSLYDSLIARHLRPNAGPLPGRASLPPLPWWHLGLDEVDAYAGIDERDVARVVDPWCRCPNCAGRSRAALLAGFAARCIAHLVDQGVHLVTLWHDALARLNAYPLFKEELAARGLQERVAVQWWRYSDPPLAVGERGLRAWVTPMAGYWSNLFHHDYGPNIQAMAAEGRAAGAEGLDAYCIYDPAYFRNYALLASLGLDEKIDLAGFRAAFGRWLFETGPLPGGEGRANQAREGEGTAAGAPEGRTAPPEFAHFDTLFDSSYGPLGSVLDALLRYWWTYPAQRHVRYPRDQVAQVAADPLRIGRALAAAQAQAERLRGACQRAAPQAPDARRRRLLEEYACEAHKLAGIVAAFRQAAAGWNHYRRAQAGPTRAESVEALTRAEAAFQAAQSAVLEVMAELERVKAPYLQPQILRDLTPLYEWLGETRARTRDVREHMAAGGLDEAPAL